MPLFSASALPYNIDQLDYAESRFRHPSDLKANDYVDVNVDLRQMGVGGDDSWGAKPMQKYLIPAGKYSYSLSWSGQYKTADNPMELSKRQLVPVK